MKWRARLVVGSGARAVVVSLLAATSAGAGCTTNHDALARRPSGAGGGGAAGASGFGAGGFGNTGNGSSQGGRTNPDAEPPGDDVLTIVNGIVDASSVALCFARLSESGDESKLVGEPLPELSYGASAFLTELPDASFADDTLVPWAIVGDLALVQGLDCADAVALAVEEEAKVTPVDVDNGAGGAGGAGADAGGGGAGALPEPEPLRMPALRARSMAAIPAGTVDIGRSILLVLSGCVGGAAFTDTVEQAACGGDYSSETPTVQPVVVKLSRDIGFEKIGLQAVQASLGVTGTIDVRASGDEGVVSLTFASDVGFGGIEPRPADVRFGALELGTIRSDYGLQAIDDSGVLFQQAWSDIRESAQLAELSPSRTYTAILLGPNPLLVKTGWWQPSTFALVDNDPTRE